MSKRISVKHYGFVILALVAANMPAPAHAGFQWVAPSGSVAAPAPVLQPPMAAPVTPTDSVPIAPLTLPSPQATGTPQPLSPVVLEGSNQSTVTLSTSESQPIMVPVSPEMTKPVAELPPLPTDVTIAQKNSAINAKQDIATSPVVIDGNSHPAASKIGNNPELPSPIIIQGNNNSSSNTPPSEILPNDVVMPFSSSESASSGIASQNTSNPSAPILLPVTPIASSASSEEPIIMPASQRSTTVIASAGSIPSQAMPQPELALAPPLSQISSTSVPSSDVVHGFANHVPLAVALREILPSGYGFAIDQEVDMGVLISFQGGKPWRDTLDQALAPAGLVVREKGQMIEIGYPVGKDLIIQPADTGTSSSGPKLTTPVHLNGYPVGESKPVIIPVSATSSELIGESKTSTSSGAVTSQSAWDAEPGDSLHKVLENWSRRANIELDWMAEYDYPLQASAHFTGSFEDAVRNLLTGFEGAHPQPIAELHSNAKAGQMVLVITTRGNSSE